MAPVWVQLIDLGFAVLAAVTSGLLLRLAIARPSEFVADLEALVKGRRNRVSDETDRKVIQCNYVEATKTVAAGARAYVVYPNLGGGCDRVCVLVRSRRGRFVEKWEHRRRLGNFRAKTLPPAHPMYPNTRLHPPTDTVLDELRAAGARLGSAP